jgi:hypothetical protein
VGFLRNSAPGTAPFKTTELRFSLPAAKSIQVFSNALNGIRFFMKDFAVIAKLAANAEMPPL